MEERDIRFDVNGERITGDQQHVNPDGKTDAEKGAAMGGIGGAVVGAVAGSMVGPVGTVIGGVVGAVAGGVGSGAAVAQVDKFDNDSTTTGLNPDRDDDVLPQETDTFDRTPPVGPPYLDEQGRPVPTAPLGQDQNPARQHPYEPKNPYAPADPDIDRPLNDPNAPLNDPDRYTRRDTGIPPEPPRD